MLIIIDRDRNSKEISEIKRLRDISINTIKCKAVTILVRVFIKNEMSYTSH